MTGARPHAPWRDIDAAVPARPTAASGIRPVAYDVLVVGAGVVGCTAAIDAVRRGMSVALIESRAGAGEGVSGASSAVVTCGPGLRAPMIARLHGDATAIEYLRACAAGLAFIRDEGADAREHDHVVVASDAADLDGLGHAARLARDAGLEVRASTAEDVPWPAAGAVRYPGSMLVDPVDHLRRLLAEAAALGCDIGFETALIGFDAGDPHEAWTTRGRVQARHVILATHVPVLHRTLAFARVVQRWHVGVAGVTGTSVPVASDVSGRAPSTHPVGRGRAVVVATASERAPVSAAMDGVLAWARERAGLAATHAWCAREAHPDDALPLVGGVVGTPRLWIGTGFAGWGIAAGTAAGLDLVRRIVGEHVLAPSWRPDRLGMARGLGTIATAGARTARGIVADAVTLPERDLLATAASLSPGEGAMVRSGLTPYAVSVDVDGSVHIVHGRCSHFGCVLRWNAATPSWDCPCHGSRFAPDGSVLHGPATEPLAGVGRERAAGGRARRA